MPFEILEEIFDHSLSLDLFVWQMRNPSGQYFKYQFGTFAVGYCFQRQQGFEENAVLQIEVRLVCICRTIGRTTVVMKYVEHNERQLPVMDIAVQTGQGFAVQILEQVGVQFILSDSLLQDFAEQMVKCLLRKIAEFGIRVALNIAYALQTAASFVIVA